MERLEQRITELERRASRYRNALVLLVVGMCAVAVVGANSEGLNGIDDKGVITGKALLILNDAGMPVVSIGSDNHRDGVMNFYTFSGEPRIYLGNLKNDNGFLIQGYNKTGESVSVAGSDLPDCPQDHSQGVLAREFTHGT